MVTTDANRTASSHGGRESQHRDALEMEAYVTVVGPSQCVKAFQ